MVEITPLKWLVSFSTFQLLLLI